MLSIYGKDIRVKRGKVHSYLVMNIDFSDKGSIKVSTIKHVNKILYVFPK